MRSRRIDAEGEGSVFCSVLDAAGCLRRTRSGKRWAPGWAADIYYSLPGGEELPALIAAKRCLETRRAILTLVDMHQLSAIEVRDAIFDLLGGSNLE